MKLPTYRDHPMAFLSGRASHEGIAMRAETWREKGLSVPGMDVTARLEEASRLVRECTGAVRRILDCHEEAIRSAVESAVPVPDAAADRLFAAGQFLRVGHKDPHGGSTASHLEMAADEVRHLSASIVRMKALAEQGSAPETLRAEAMAALGVLVTEPNSEAPPLRM